ncbi:MAG: ribonuclease R [Clostridia bacterium]|nr:ribonuclease R [Clostridia bacterium]
MNFEEVVYNKILGLHKQKFTLADLSHATGFEHGFDKRALVDALNSLIKHGRLKRYKNGEYVALKHEELIKCTLLGTSKDYAFARPISGEKDNDIFISVANLNDACHGDTVMVEIGITGKERRFRRDLPLVAQGKREGRVAEIVERGFKVVVGILSINDRGIATVLPDDTRFAESVFVANSDINGAPNGSKVVLDILDYPSAAKMARGRVREILGDPKDARVTTLSIIRSYNLFEEFPDDVVAEAKKVDVPVETEKQTGRKDYRNRVIFTIDGDDARDFDDAISIEKHGENYRLGVYIADVSHYVREGSKLDAEAFKRGTSVYFPDHVLPMLPVELSNGICSLNPNENRFVLAVEMTIARNGKVTDYEIHKGIIKSKYRMTYNKVTKILNGDKEMCEKYAELVPILADMKDLAEILIARRDAAGQLDFDIPEPEIILNKDGTVADVHRKPREMSDKIIEQFMVITNEVIARHFDKMELPFVYRVHEPPVLERVQKFRAFAAGLGLKFVSSSKDPSPKDFQVLLKLSEGQDYSTALSKVMLRSMQKARYDTVNLGHFGLALRDYCHFTSPIRRYPDLSIHRIISESLEGKLNQKRIHELEEFVSNSAERSSTMERQAEEAERTVDDQKKTEFMANKIGEVYEGVISSVTANGFYVELENTVEGFVSILRLPQAAYEYNETRYSLSGNGAVYKIGDKIEIRVVSVDIVLRRVDFELSNFHREVTTEERIDFLRNSRSNYENSQKNNENYSKNAKNFHNENRNKSRKHQMRKSKSGGRGRGKR